MAAILYLRSARADDTGLIRAQERACRDWCKRNGEVLADTYIDRGASGNTMPQDRPNLLAAIQALRPKDVLVAVDMSRIARCPLVAAEVRKLCMERDAMVAFARQYVDP